MQINQKSRVLIKTIILFILTLFMANVLFFNTVNAADAKVVPSPTPSAITLDKNTNNISTDLNTVQIKDVYEALLKTKDDKLVLLSNIISWGLGFGGIVVVVLGAFFGYLLRKVSKQSNKASAIIKRFEGKEIEIANIQDKINTVLESTNFHEKLIDMENNMNKSSILISRWEKEEIERNNKEDLRIRNHALNLARDALYLIELNNMKARMTETHDLETLEQCKKFVESNVAHMDDDTPTIEFKYVYMYLNTLKEKYQMVTDHNV